MGERNPSAAYLSHQLYSMSQEMYLIKEFGELLVCQHATNFLPSHSALPDLKQSAKELKVVFKKKKHSCAVSKLFRVGLKNLPACCLISLALIRPPPRARWSSAGCHSPAAELDWAFIYGGRSKWCESWSLKKKEAVSDDLSTELLLPHRAVVSTWGVQ